MSRSRITQVDAKNQTTRFEYDKLAGAPSATLPLGQSRLLLQRRRNLTSKTDINARRQATSTTRRTA